MATVTVRQPATINVKVGNKPATVQSINYGTKTIKGSADLSMSGAAAGDAILFDSANNTFYVAPVTSTINEIDGGYF